MKPSISIWIDPADQTYKVEFNPQELSPAQYGVVIASIMIHIAKMFGDSNLHVPQETILRQMRKGLDAGLEQLQDVVLPSKAH